MSKEGNTLTQAIECNVSLERDVPDWSEYLAHHSDATVYHDPRWGRILHDACSGHPFFLTARRGGRIVGVFQLVGQRSFLFGSRLCSLPYFDASGILADDNQARLALLHKSKELRESEGYAALEVRQLRFCAENAPTRTDKVTLWLDIPNSSEAMWKQLKTKVRTKIRKTQKNNFEFASGGIELLDNFHDVYSRTMRDLGSPPHGKRIFERILAEFPEETRLFVEFGANRFLYWEMLSHVAKIGAGRFDFGRSTIDSGTYGFKREWGAEPVQLHWQYFSISCPEERRCPKSGQTAASTN